MRLRHPALSTTLVLAVALAPANLLAQRRGFPDVAGGRVGGGFGHHGFGHPGFGHHGTHFGFGAGIHPGRVHFGVGLGFDSFHQAVVQPRFFHPAFVPSGFPVFRHHLHAVPVFVPVVPVFGGTTVVVVPGFGRFVNNGYYVDPPAQETRATEAQSQSNYVVASGSAGSVASTPRLILLAFQDHSIYAATDYWVEGDTIYYTTSYGARNNAPLASLDLALTVELNRERGVDFSLDSRTVR